MSTTAGPFPREADNPHVVFRPGEKSMGKTIKEDLAVFVRHQVGFRSRGCKGVYMAGCAGKPDSPLP
ncbi:MAG: hypothetical protein R3E84_10005 [Pseudomonadales bacterium]